MRDEEEEEEEEEEKKEEEDNDDDDDDNDDEEIEDKEEDDEEEEEDEEEGLNTLNTFANPLLFLAFVKSSISFLHFSMSLFEIGGSTLNKIVSTFSVLMDVLIGAPSKLLLHIHS